MTITIELAIPDDGWVELSGSNSHGYFTNSGQHNLLCAEALTKPAADSNLGHQLSPNRDLEFKVVGSQKVWVKALNGAGRLILTSNVFSKGRLTTAEATIVSPLTYYDDLQVAELSPIFQYNFEYTVDNTELTINTVTGGGTVTQAEAMAVISSSTTTGSTACLQTKRKARYKSGFGALLRITTLYENGGVAGTEQWFGLADEIGSSVAFKNGYVLGFSGEAFRFNRFQNDAEFPTEIADWDDPLDGSGPSGEILDETNLNIWFISFGHLGAGGAILFWQHPSTKQMIKVLGLPYSNLHKNPAVFMPNFHGTAFVDNKATSVDLVIKTGSMAYFVEGKAEPIILHQPQTSSDIKIKTDVTGEIAIFTIRNKTTYAGKTNFIEVQLEDFAYSIEALAANNLAELRIVRNATLGGTPDFSDINTTDSVLEIDVAGTTVTDGKLLVPRTLAGKNDSKSDNLLPFKVILAPGETATVAGTSVSAATMKAALLVRELF